MRERVGDAVGGGELRAVDDVAAVAGQGVVADGLGVRRAGLGVLAAHAAELDDRDLGAEGQDDGHLQHDAEGVADDVAGVLGEAFGAVAALQHEGAGRRRRGRAGRAGCGPRLRTPGAGRRAGAARPRAGRRRRGSVGICCTGRSRQPCGVQSRVSWIVIARTPAAAGKGRGLSAVPGGNARGHARGAGAQGSKARGSAPGPRQRRAFGNLDRDRRHLPALSLCVRVWGRSAPSGSRAAPWPCYSAAFCSPASRVRLAHGDPFLRAGGMDADGLVEVRLGGAGGDGDADALHHLRGVVADHVGAEDALAGLVDDELHQGAVALRGRSWRGASG